jgi:hypothetical protein
LDHQHSAQKVVGLQRVAELFGEVVDALDELLVTLNGNLGVVQGEPAVTQSSQRTIFVDSLELRVSLFSQVEAVDSEVGEHLDSEAGEVRERALTIPSLRRWRAAGRGCCTGHR